MGISCQRSRRGPVVCLIVAIAVAIATALPTRAQLGESGLNWQQRFLGILPLVKPDPKDPVVVTVNGAPITAAEISDYANTEKHMINATSTEEIEGGVSRRDGKFNQPATAAAGGRAAQDYDSRP